jgi:hypothetical protein
MGDLSSGRDARNLGIKPEPEKPELEDQEAKK